MWTSKRAKRKTYNALITMFNAKAAILRAEAKKMPDDVPFPVPLPYQLIEKADILQKDAASLWRRTWWEYRAQGDVVVLKQFIRACNNEIKKGDRETWSAIKKSDGAWFHHIETNRRRSWGNAISQADRLLATIK